MGDCLKDLEREGEEWRRIGTDREKELQTVDIEKLEREK